MNLFQNQRYSAHSFRHHVLRASLWAVLGLPLACFAGKSHGVGGPEGAIDITYKAFSKDSPRCADYAETYSSTVKDVKQATTLQGKLTITLSHGKCVFKSNGIPNHDFNDKQPPFANKVKEVAQTFEVPTEPKPAPEPTPLTVLADNAIFLNGVKLDLLAAACYGVGLETQKLGEEKIDCFDMDWAWRYDPLHPMNNFRADSHNAHAQPDGAYHYHGNPRALFISSDPTKPSPLPTKPSPVIGFAADGFPIYGPYIDDNGTIRRVRSGYVLKQGPRQHLPNQAYFPGGHYDGRFRDDYEFKAAGDLDECNGMTRNNQYGYYVTFTYPWVMGCFRGTPDPSFKKKEAEGHSH